MYLLTHSFYSFAVHFVVSVGFSEEETCISLLIDEQIWKVNLRERKSKAMEMNKIIIG